MFSRVYPLELSSPLGTKRAPPPYGSGAGSIVCVAWNRNAGEISALSETSGTTCVVMLGLLRHSQVSIFGCSREDLLH